jgi:hypothetical protein
MTIRTGRRPLPDMPPLTCPDPDCGQPMRLRHRPAYHDGSPWWYVCVGWAKCGNTHGAHSADGRPLGTPADAATRKARVDAHAALDSLWRGDGAPLTRGGAYRWLQRVMGLSEGDAHVGRMTADQCRAVIVAVRRDWPGRG